MPTAPAQFLNLDLALKSNSDLSTIIDHFNEKAVVLHHHEDKGEWTLVLELADEASTGKPSRCAQGLLAIISEFPDGVRDAWKACTSRSFSFGFDGGFNAPALEAAISADLLLQIAGIGGDIAITVYPYRDP